MIAMGDGADLPVRYAHVGFWAQSHAGEWVALPDNVAKQYKGEPARTRVFAQTAEGVKFSADEMFLWYLRKSKTEAAHHCPARILKEKRVNVDFAIGFPPGSFHIATDDGDVDLKRLVLVIEFSLVEH